LSLRFSTSTRSSQLGNPFDTSFWMKPFFLVPAGNRSIVIGRPRMCGIINGATAS